MLSKTYIALLSESLVTLYDAREANNIAVYVLEEMYGIDLVRTNNILSQDQLEALYKIQQRLLTHEPVQYVLGEAWFYGRKFIVSPAVLIPRPETEELVELAIKSNKLKNPKILDIGSGSGCINITLKLEIPEAAVFAIDISAEALEITNRNARLYKAQLQTLQADMLNPDLWATSLPQFDIIISNPPYISPSDKKGMENNVLLFEPESALFANHPNPLIFYSQIADFACQKLHSGGKLYLEIPSDKTADIHSYLKKAGLKNIETHKDMQGRDRIISATRE